MIDRQRLAEQNGAMATPRNTLEDFLKFYGRRPSTAELAVEREVYGVNAGIISYSGPAQADLLADALELGPGVRVLEVGAGSGWPGAYLAKHTGCNVTMTDVPVPAVRSAAARSIQEGVFERCAFAVASGIQLPFRQRSFDALIHSDVL
jgi:protein-L-isoaspartate O-methyltransferase